MVDGQEESFKLDLNLQPLAQDIVNFLPKGWLYRHLCSDQCSANRLVDDQW
jgi:hypothetical protein